MGSTEIPKQILEMQSESTKRALARDPLNDTWPPHGWLAVPEAKTHDEMVQARYISEEDMVFYGGNEKVPGLRQKVGGRLAEIRNEADANSITPEKRSSAIDAHIKPVGEQIKLYFKNLMHNISETYEEMLVSIRHEK